MNITEITEKTRNLGRIFAVVLAILIVVITSGLLQSASAQEEKTRIERLLQAELNEFWVDENGWTQLHWSAAANDAESARRLLEMGAAINFTDKGDGFAFSDKGKRRFELLGRKKDTWKNLGHTPLWTAIDFRSYVVAAILIERGANIHAANQWGQTPLHRAAVAGALDTAKMLIKRGADVNVKSKQQKMPLHFAVVNNAPDVAEFLIERGAEVNAKDGKGWTPVDLAILMKHDKMRGLVKRYGGRCNLEC